MGKEKSGLIELKDLLKSVATKAGLPAEILLRKGRLAKVVEARDRFNSVPVLEPPGRLCVGANLREGQA